MITRMPPEAEDDRVVGVDGQALAREIGAAPDLER